METEAVSLLHGLMFKIVLYLHAEMHFKYIPSRLKVSFTVTNKGPPPAVSSTAALLLFRGGFAGLSPAGSL